MDCQDLMAALALPDRVVFELQTGRIGTENGDSLGALEQVDARREFGPRRGAETTQVHLSFVLEEPRGRTPGGFPPSPVLAAFAAWLLKEAAERNHECLTGDCPHEKNHECVNALVGHFHDERRGERQMELEERVKVTCVACDAVREISLRERSALEAAGQLVVCSGACRIAYIRGFLARCRQDAEALAAKLRLLQHDSVRAAAAIRRLGEVLEALRDPHEQRDA